MEFKCHLCNKTKKTKKALLSHYNSTHKNDPRSGNIINTLESNFQSCKYCAAKYANSYNLKAHQDKCVKNFKNVCDVIQSYNPETLREFDNWYKKFSQENTYVNQNCINGENVTVNNSSINNTNTNIVNNNNVSLNNLGQEKLDHVDTPEVASRYADKLGEPVIPGGGTWLGARRFLTENIMLAVLDSLTEVYFNPDVKENHCIYIPNKKTTEPFLLYHNNKWIRDLEGNKKKIVTEIENKSNEVYNTIERHKVLSPDLLDLAKEDISLFIEKSNTKTLDKLYKKFHRLGYENRKIVEETYKQTKN